MRRFVPILALASTVSCGLGNDDAAPYADPPTDTGPCQSTDALLPRLHRFLDEERFTPLREVIEDRLIPSEANPAPDPSWRSVVNALLRLVRQLGLDQTAYVVDIASKREVEEQVSPAVAALLRLVDGRVDGVPRYEVGDAAGHFVRVCNPNHLLTALEEVLRLESPSTGDPWLVALLDAAQALVREPELSPFLDGFERNAETGRPVVVALLRQIMALVADDGFSIERVETLLESAVYPAVGPELEARLERLVVLLDEVTRPEAGVLVPLQGAVRCGNMHPEERDVLLGFVFDLVATPELGLNTVLDGVGVLQVDVIASELALFADVVHVVRTDLTIRDDLRAVLVMLLSRPNVQKVVPVLIGLLEEQIFSELLVAVVELLDGCGRA